MPRVSQVSQYGRPEYSAVRCLLFGANLTDVGILRYVCLLFPDGKNILAARIEVPGVAEPVQYRLAHTTAQDRNQSTITTTTSRPLKALKKLSKDNKFNYLGVTSDVTGHVKVKMFDFSCLVTSTNKIAMLSSNKANESAWIVSLTFVSITYCDL